MVRLPEPHVDPLVAAAERHGLYLAAGHRFGVDGGFEQYLRLPFASPPAVLIEAVDRLAAAYDDATASTGDIRRGPAHRLIA